MSALLRLCIFDVSSKCTIQKVQVQKKIFDQLNKTINREKEKNI